MRMHACMHARTHAHAHAWTLTEKWVWFGLVYMLDLCATVLAPSKDQIWADYHIDMQSIIGVNVSGILQQDQSIIPNFTFSLLEHVIS